MNKKTLLYLFATFFLILFLMVSTYLWFVLRSPANDPIYAQEIQNGITAQSWKEYKSTAAGLSLELPSDWNVREYYPVGSQAKTPDLIIDTSRFGSALTIKRENGLKFDRLTPIQLQDGYTQSQKVVKDATERVIQSVKVL